ncbi:hypothetical protein CLOBOL_00325 [Enterocloster bolteae ATCC BAA-613]|uniref:Uncharacterized protein n=1 Tax=Enterocloster bolteae (strain ATCC BAA-613 / DSM 15670 / CCUG 46953 / JCM 12243 / WAL 16351) TaxID=411902 RepID=A8RH64_ENTBW|nr:hypothetical protein CLOBOL_00325 [Enterocloster bolteae ATCC BAA-613]
MNSRNRQGRQKKAGFGLPDKCSGTHTYLLILRIS